MTRSQTPRAGASSPPTSSPPRQAANAFMSPPRNKERRMPSVTPRRFRRFFNPRFRDDSPAQLLSREQSSRGVLDDISSSNLNSQYVETPTKRKSLGGHLQSSPVLPDPEPLRKRTRVTDRATAHPFSDDNVEGLQHRLNHDQQQTPEPPPSIIVSQHEADISRPKTLSGFWRFSRSAVSQDDVGKSGRLGLAEMDVDEVDEEQGHRPAELVRYRSHGMESQLLGRELGCATRTGRLTLQYPSLDPHPDIAAYCSTGDDVLRNTDMEEVRRLVPFCVATTMQGGVEVTAVGDEEGFIRFITRENDGLAPRYWWRAHRNAIMDMDWSPGGRHIATAAGDRNGRILDVATQRHIVNLAAGHEGCLRQVKFQPGQSAGCVVATSDRSSLIQIWDTRFKRPCTTIPEDVFLDPNGRVLSTSQSTTYGDATNSLWCAHRRGRDCNPASVTSLQWLPPGHEHLLLSASEADATLKLWDMRYVGYSKDSTPKPLSSTAAPADHFRRPHGITSLSLNTDASRIYAVCKNSTVYAYATSHLILGSAPELASSETPKPRNGRRAQGLDPLYGFRHARLNVNTFYIKSAVLPSTAHGTEILAVGSSDGCPVLFPTDERQMQIEWERQNDRARDADVHHDIGPSQGSQPDVLPLSQASDAQPDGRIPVYQKGAALIEGTTKEVSSVKWTSDGTLISISDDYRIRFWRHDADQARFLRTCGYFGGHRHQAGWADVQNSGEQDEDDDTFDDTDTDD